jgi:hypothetical protein
MTHRRRPALDQDVVGLAQPHEQQVRRRAAHSLDSERRAARQQPLVLRYGLSRLERRVAAHVTRTAARIQREDHARPRLPEEALDGRQAGAGAAEAPPDLVPLWGCLATRSEPLQLRHVLVQRRCPGPVPLDATVQDAALVLGQLEERVLQQPDVAPVRLGVGALAPPQRGVEGAEEAARGPAEAVVGVEVDGRHFVAAERPVVGALHQQRVDLGVGALRYTHHRVSTGGTPGRSFSSPPSRLSPVHM